jgi:hypothetical protein
MARDRERPELAHSQCRGGHHRQWWSSVWLVRLGLLISSFVLAPVCLAAPLEENASIAAATVVPAAGGELDTAGSLDPESTISPPPQCRVDTNKVGAIIADCRHLGLSRVPRSIPVATTELLLSGNSLTELLHAEFVVLPQLRNLYVDDNQVGDTHQPTHTHSPTCPPTTHPRIPCPVLPTPSSTHPLLSPGFGVLCYVVCRSGRYNQGYLMDCTWSGWHGTRPSVKSTHKRR